MNALIILATYNGEKYLVQQLESIIFQDSSNWVCHIFDDNSKDSTLNIISNYTKIYPEKFILHRRVIGSGSACDNFVLAYNEMVNSSYDYLLFCDQDDVWHKNKISSMNNHFASKGLNNCVFSDLEVVDSNLKILNRSYYSMIASSSMHYKSIPSLSVDNVVPGCSLAVGREWAKEHPIILHNVIMHDWWIVLNACNENCLFYLDFPLVKYRQHENNQVGVKKIAISNLPKTFLEQVKKIYQVYEMSQLIPNLKISKFKFLVYYFYVRIIKFWRFV